MKNTDTRKALLDTAEEIIQRVGVNAMSYNDLSKVVGIRKASIHHHFPKKVDLISALVERYGINQGCLYSAVINSDLGTKDKLKGIAAIFQASISENKICLVGMLSSERETMCEELQKIIKDAVRKGSEGFGKIFNQGINEGLFAQKIDTTKAGYAFLSFLVGLQIFTRSTGNIQNFKEMTDQYIDMIIDR